MGSKKYYTMSKYAKGKYELKNPQKYTGKRQPTYRSSWEWAFMKFCDDHPNVVHWASESIHIPYFNPLKQQNTIYVPDFLVEYKDKNGKTRVEMIEIKPSGEILETQNKKSVRQQAMAILNHCKWEAARKWCNANGIIFRIVTENEIFHNPKKTRKFKTR